MTYVYVCVCVCVWFLQNTWSSTTALNIDNNQFIYLLEWFLKDHMTLKTGVMNKLDFKIENNVKNLCINYHSKV